MLWAASVPGPVLQHSGLPVLQPSPNPWCSPLSTFSTCRSCPKAPAWGFLLFPAPRETCGLWLIPCPVPQKTIMFLKVKFKSIFVPIPFDSSLFEKNSFDCFSQTISCCCPNQLHLGQYYQFEHLPRWHPKLWDNSSLVGIQIRVSQ